MRGGRSCARKELAILQRLFFISDVHSPYHDKQAWRIVLDVLRDFQPDIFVSNGDFLDCFSVSRHSKSPIRLIGFKQEIEQANKLLDDLDGILTESRRIFVEGNHEERLTRYINDRAPELHGLVEIPRELRLEERGWEHVHYRDDIKIGKLYITHDVGSTGRYAVFKAGDVYQASVVTGHTHRLAYCVEGDATGSRKVSASFGWIGDVAQVDYMHRVKARREWATGFGYGYVDPKTGYCYLIPCPIIRGTCVVEGKLYTGRTLKAVA